MLVAKSLPDSDILVMTYNKRLKCETRERVGRAGLRHMEVHSFHSMAVRYYHPLAWQGGVMADIVRRDAPPLGPLPPYRLIVLDEVAMLLNSILELNIIYFHF
jgi:hypothetical protein